MEPVNVEVTSREARERGMTMAELRAEKAALVAPNPYTPGAYERGLATFLSARIEEAQWADVWHMLPGNLPIDQQPWWKTSVWFLFLSGRGDGAKVRAAR